MDILTDSWLWFTVGSTVSAIMAVVLTNMTLQKKYGTTVTVTAWVIAVCAYFAFVYLGMMTLSSYWFSYLAFFGWLIFLTPPAILVYKDSLSTRFLQLHRPYSWQM